MTGVQTCALPISTWMGGGWGWVDPVKEVGAAIAAILAGLSTHSKELAAQGEDFEEVFEQLAREKEFAAALGLNFSAPKGSAGPAAPPDDDERQTGRQDNLALALQLLSVLDQKGE